MSGSYFIRPFVAADDHLAVLKLLRAVASFDGSVAVPTADELATLVDHPLTDHGRAWQVAVSQGAVVGVLDVRFVGTKRAEVRFAVNPAFRRQGIGHALLASVPKERRLLVTSRASVPAATATLTKAGFTERHRDVRLRQAARAFGALEVPSWAELEEDRTRNPRRYVAMLHALGEDDLDDPTLAAAYLARPGCRVFYLSSPKGDDGMAVIAAKSDAKKADQGPDGAPVVGVLEKAALTKALRGKGLSRPLVRAGLNALVDDGYKSVEVTAEKRQKTAVDLYLKEGFEVVDEDVHWIRRDDEP